MTVTIGSLMPALYALVGVIIGVLASTGLHHVFGRSFEAEKHLRLQKGQAYADFFKSMNLASQGGLPAELRSQAADAKVRICLYGSPRVITSLAAFESAGASTIVPAGRAALITLLADMRRDVGAKAIAAISDKIEPLMLGPLPSPPTSAKSS